MTDTYACGITMHRPEGDLYEILGVGEDVSQTEAIFLGYDLRKTGMSKDQRYAWKALSDRHYNAVYKETRSTKALFDAGFFDDGLPKLPSEYKSNNLRTTVTPFGKVHKNIKAGSSKPRAVLFTTGGMAPIHNGHIEMMEEAKRIMEDKGYDVVGGFFCPGHDSYVGQKYGGTAAIPAEHRCAMVELAVQDSNWLECDPWAARYMPSEINFTAIFDYLYSCLKYEWVEIFYVYGSDNEGFGKALPNNSIMIERTSLSSKMAREGHHDHLDPRVRDYLENWQKPNTTELPYLIRNEENFAIAGWAIELDKEELTRRRVQFQSAVRLGFAQLFKNAGLKSKVCLMNVSDQRIKAREVIGQRKTISLDPFFEGHYHIDMTRYFEPYNAQFKPLLRAQRAGHPDLETQLSRVPAGEYVLVEDDTVTGDTIRAITENLPPEVKITDQVILSDFGEYAGTEYFDVVDLRDFLVGSSYGGLSVILEGRMMRVPYLMPFVSLRARAKVPAEVEMELSRVIWQANIKFFKGSNIKIQNCNFGFQDLANYLGFGSQETVESFCEYYLKMLLEAAGV
jgi:hypothetical protein